MSTEQLTIGTIITKTVPFLAEKKIPNPRLEADLMLAKVLEQPRVKLYSEWDRILKPNEVQQYREVILKRVQGCPLAYISGKKSFLSWDFTVSPAVLIPRPETELVIETAVELVKKRSKLSDPELLESEFSGDTVSGLELAEEAVTGLLQPPDENSDMEPLQYSKPSSRVPNYNIYGLDVGTGSGVIAITLAKLLPGSIWVATDISQEALEVARENADILGVAAQIEFISGDLLDPILSGQGNLNGRKFDLIVSNPPYIPSGEIVSLQKEVRQEPILALDGGVDGLEIYRRLIPLALKVLNDDGIVVVEHGYDQRQSLEGIFKESGFVSCRSYKDMSELERVLVAGRTVW